MFASKDTLLTRPSGYNIARSVRFRSSASGYFNRTQTTGNRRTYTYSAWVKRGNLTTKQNLFGSLTYVPPSQNDQSYWSFLADNTFEIALYSNAAYLGQLITTQVFRDPSAWYHIVVQVDTTQATSSNRLKLYVNGTQITSFSTTNYPTQNTDTFINANGYGVGIGRVYPYVGAEYFDGFQTEINFIDGQALTPSSFGETDSITGVWKPKAYSGTYGTNGFYLNFSDNSNNTAATIGKDYSGNGNNWTPNNISVTTGATYDSMTDVPTLTSATTGNYCTWNPLWKQGGTTAGTWSKDGNLNAQADTNTSMVVYGTMKFGIGNKIYSEFTMTNVVDNNDAIGIVSDVDQTTGTVDSGTCVMYRVDGQKNVNGTVSAYGSSYADGDIIGVAVDLSANSVTFYKNNTSQGAITGITAVDYLHRVRFNNVASQQAQCIANWGQRPFSYTPPTGFVALNTYNLPASTITNGAAYMAATLWTGTGASPRVISGLGFQPDFTWIKARSIAYNHRSFDSVRGAGKQLSSNLTSAEVTNDVDGYLSSLNSDGFTLTAGSASMDVVNQNTQTYVAWNWKAGGTSASNTNGSITSTVSVGATQGFSVVTYTGTGANATVGHGLGVAPQMIIIKNRPGVYNWRVWHTALSSTELLFLNTTDAKQTGQTTAWNSTLPSSTVFSLGSSAGVNESAVTFVAYCFSAVAGYSAFGSFSGNGSADGPFVYTSFRPRWILVKQTNAGGEDWVLSDGTRDPINVVDSFLAPNSSSAEATGVGAYVDYLSNGFKIRTDNPRYNASGGTYIYACFAENPFKNSLAR